MFPRLNANGRPGKSAMLLGAFGCIFVGQRERETWQEILRDVDGRLLYYFVEPSQYEVNYSVSLSGNEIWINTYGTENVQQLLAYSTTLVPARDQRLSTYVMPWAFGQVESMLDRVTRYVRQYHSPRVVLCGHSLGGAVCYYLGCLLKAQQFDWQPSIEVLTFGEPRSVGSGPRYVPDVHFRIVSASGSGPLAETDAVTFLPFNVAVAPILGVGSQIIGTALKLIRSGLDLTPHHQGQAFFVTRQGEYVNDPYAELGRPLQIVTEFARDLALGGLGLLDPSVVQLHYLVPTYLGAAIRIYASGSGEDMPNLEARATNLERRIASASSDLDYFAPQTRQRSEVNLINSLNSLARQVEREEVEREEAALARLLIDPTSYEKYPPEPEVADLLVRDWREQANLPPIPITAAPTPMDIIQARTRRPTHR